MQLCHFLHSQKGSTHCIPRLRFGTINTGSASDATDGGSATRTVIATMVVKSWMKHQTSLFDDVVYSVDLPWDGKISLVTLWNTQFDGNALKTGLQFIKIDTTFCTMHSILNLLNKIKLKKSFDPSRCVLKGKIIHHVCWIVVEQPQITTTVKVATHWTWKSDFLPVPNGLNHSF